MFTEYLSTVVTEYYYRMEHFFLNATPPHKIIPFFLQFYVLYNNVKKCFSST